MGGQSERKEKDTAADKKPSLLVCFFFLMLIENGDSLATGVCALSSVCFSLSYREHTQPQMRKDTWRDLKHTYTHTCCGKTPIREKGNTIKKGRHWN